METECNREELQGIRSPTLIEDPNDEMLKAFEYPGDGDTDNINTVELPDLFR